jgi:hypothetical protein
MINLLQQFEFDIHEQFLIDHNFFDYLLIFFLKIKSFSTFDFPVQVLCFILSSLKLQQIFILHQAFHFLSLTFIEHFQQIKNWIHLFEVVVRNNPRHIIELGLFDLFENNFQEFDDQCLVFFSEFLLSDDEDIISFINSSAIILLSMKDSFEVLSKSIYKQNHLSSFLVGYGVIDEIIKNLETQ